MAMSIGTSTPIAEPVPLMVVPRRVSVIVRGGTPGDAESSFQTPSSGDGDSVVKSFDPPHASRVPTAKAQQSRRISTSGGRAHLLPGRPRLGAGALREDQDDAVSPLGSIELRGGWSFEDLDPRNVARADVIEARPRRETVAVEKHERCGWSNGSIAQRHRGDVRSGQTGCIAGHGAGCQS